MAEVTIARIEIPESLDDPNAGRLLDMVRIANAMSIADTGHDYLTETADEVLGFWQDQSDWTNIGYAAERDGQVIGILRITISNEPDVSAIEFDVLIDPDRWGEGAEELLFAEVEREARARGILTIQSWTLHRPERERDLLVPPTGFGAVPADDRQTQLMLRNGYTLEQVERNSVFDLRGSFDQVERMLHEALAAAGGDYRLLTWTAPTPAEHLDGFAAVLARMSTDAPAAGLVIDEQHWDAARVRRRDARLAAQGLTVSVAAVQHIPTGAIAAYNELVVSDEPGAATQQYGTLVLKDHRGRRLGTVVKCANLIRWRDLAPSSPRVSTFNAEENRHMLDINEAIGFVPVSYAGAWKKVLS